MKRKKTWSYPWLYRELQAWGLPREYATISVYLPPECLLAIINHQEEIFAPPTVTGARNAAMMMMIMMNLTRLARYIHKYNPTATAPRLAVRNVCIGKISSISLQLFSTPTRPRCECLNQWFPISCWSSWSFMTTNRKIKLVFFFDFVLLF